MVDSILNSTTLQSYDVILILAAMILTGMIVGRFAERYHIPNISGYLIVGICFGLVLTFLNHDGLLDLFMYFTKFALGFIALSIGLELDIKKIWKRRNEVLIVTITQALFAFAFTTIGLVIFRMDFHIALLLGTIAIATEPGPILFLTKRYKTKGDLTNTLVPLHGVEDAFAIILFGLALSYAVGIDSGIAPTVLNLIHGPIYELVFSLLIGIGIGLVLRFIIKKLDYEDVDKDLVVFVSVFVAIMIALSLANRGFYFFGVHVHLSPVLLPMVVGITFTNTSSKLAKHETEGMLDLFSPPVIIAFFTVVGAEIVFLIANQSSNVPLRAFLLYSTVYILFRIAGKLIGSYFGGFLAKSSKNIKKYLGFCLLPQAQAAIGLAFYARTRLSDPVQGSLLILVVIAGTLIYELFGPFGLRHSLIRCEEVDENGACIIREKKPRIKKTNHLE